MSKLCGSCKHLWNQVGACKKYRDETGGCMVLSVDDERQTYPDPAAWVRCSQCLAAERRAKGERNA
jgi:hypothetical protein